MNDNREQPGVLANGEGSVDWLQDPPLGYRLVKRSVDTAFSAIALTSLLPVLLMIAIVIKLTSKGPALSQQIRVGRHGVPFKYLKFRTMFTYDDDSQRRYAEQCLSAYLHAKAKNKPSFPIRRDPRITPIGRFLKQTSLGGLPQFWNVLRGDMALVGPFPPDPYLWRWGYESRHKKGLSMKPGITGLWQIDDRSHLSGEDMVIMDIEYIKRASLALDLKILFMTPFAVIRRHIAF
jgi:lipopolysaccharide/colanic/teichoic acid biosynthesis glycosyltransferase